MKMHYPVYSAVASAYGSGQQRDRWDARFSSLLDPAAQKRCWHTSAVPERAKI